MNYLDSKYIELIESDVEQARITINHLSTELVDHICCEVESLMSSGKTFDEAYSIIKEKTGIKVLQKIQENTLYLIDKKYKLMKTTMKITGNVSLALIAFGTAFKIFHWPGASPLLILGFVTLCFVFFPAAIYMNYNYSNENKKPFMNIAAGLGGVIFMIGVLFKLMHWPGAAMLLLIGWTLILLIFLPILLFVKLREAQSSREKSIYIIGALGLIIFEFSTMFKMFHWPGAGPLMLVGSLLLIGIFVPRFTKLRIDNGQMTNAQFIFVITTSMYAVVLTFLLAMNVSDVILDRFVRDETNASRIVKYFESKKAQPSASNDSTSILVDPAISEGAEKIHQLVIRTKTYIVEGVEGVSPTDAIRCLANPNLILRKDNYDIPNWILLGNGEGNKELMALKAELETFRKNAVEIVSNKEHAKYIENLLDTSDKERNGEKMSWEEMNFRNNLIISALGSLSEIDKNVRIVESLVSKKQN
jgi:hypothetical protein